MSGLNIKNEETIRLVRELSRRTGQSMTGAITVAVREQLATEAKSKSGLADWLNELTRETSAMMNDGRASQELFEELYDSETGLPK
jgi:antitoxin VapB